MLREQMFGTQCVNRAHVSVCVRGESELQARKSLVIRAHAPTVTDGDSPLETRTKQTAPPPSIFSCRLSPIVTLFFSRLPFTPISPAAHPGVSVLIICFSFSLSLSLTVCRSV